MTREVAVAAIDSAKNIDSMVRIFIDCVESLLGR